MALHDIQLVRPDINGCGVLILFKHADNMYSVPNITVEEILEELGKMPRAKMV